MIESEIQEQIRKLQEASFALMCEVEAARLTTKEALRILEELKEKPCPELEGKAS